MKRTDDQSLLSLPRRAWIGSSVAATSSQRLGVGGPSAGWWESATGRQPPGRRQVVPRVKVRKRERGGPGELRLEAVACHGATATALPGPRSKREGESHPHTQTRTLTDRHKRHSTASDDRWLHRLGRFWLEASLRHESMNTIRAFPHSRRTHDPGSVVDCAMLRKKAEPVAGRADTDVHPRGGTRMRWEETRVSESTRDNGA